MVDTITSYEVESNSKSHKVNFGTPLWKPFAENSSRWLVGGLFSEFVCARIWAFYKRFGVVFTMGTKWGTLCGPRIWVRMWGQMRGQNMVLWVYAIFDIWKRAKKGLLKAF